MSRWVAFDVVEIQQTGPNTANIIKLQDVPVNVDAIVFLVPTNIPSDLSGPGGQPIPKPGVVLSFSGIGLQGPGLMVEGSKEEILWKIESGPFIEIKEPEKNPGTEKQVKKPTLKLIHPNE